MKASTPPLVDVIAGVLRQHYVGIDPRNEGLRCECGQAVPTDDAAHQARAVLDALTEAGGVEWGVSFADDDEIEPQESRHAAGSVIAAIRAELSDPRLAGVDASDYEPMRIVTRRAFKHTTPWTVVEG